MRKTSLDAVYELAKVDERVVFIGSDLGPGVLSEMKDVMPSRFYMEGVSEQHIVGMAAGMALEGFIPYINTIATFLTRRCYEQVAIDLCLQNLPVRLLASGGGAVYAPLGPTHLAVEDIAIMRALPNMTIVAPCDALEMNALMGESLKWNGPMYIRMGKGGDEVVSTLSGEEFSIGKARILKSGKDVLLISTGIATQICIAAHENLRAVGIDATVLHMPTIKPLDTNMIDRICPEFDVVVTVEEHSLIGGLGSAILEYESSKMSNSLSKIIRIGIPDEFSKKYGSQKSLLEYWQITPEEICKKVIQRFKATR